MHVKEQIAVDLRPWSEGDLPLLERLLGDPAMMEYLGGPETPETIRERHKRYLQGNGSGLGLIFVILVGPERQPAGMIGYWEHDADGMHVWETGWSVLKEFQCQGVATAAARLVAERARADGTRRFLHAFSGTENAASNAVCRKAGFELRGEVLLEYPQANWMRCNDWVLDLLG